MLHAAVLMLALATPGAGEATIVNSGSTNVAGYRLRVSPDGSTFLNQANLPLRRRLPHALVARFFAALREAGDLAALPDAHCMKSASFGSSTRIEYHGRISPDLSCPSGSVRERTLYLDAQAIGAAAGVSMLPAPR